MADLGKLWRWLTGGDVADSPPAEATLERPWLRRWDHLPRRSAGFDFAARDYREARERAREVASATLGPQLWAQVERDGYLDLPSRCYQGLTYRLRIGRRIGDRQLLRVAARHLARVNHTLADAEKLRTASSSESKVSKTVNSLVIDSRSVIRFVRFSSFRLPP